MAVLTCEEHGSQPIRVGFTLVELLVVIAIIAMLVAILLPAVQSARESGRKTQCANNLRQIGIALKSYHSQYSKYPAGSQIPPRDVGLSWRVEILPYLELNSVYDEINPAAGPNGESLAPAKLGIPGFVCPSQGETPRNRCDYSGVMGTGTTKFVTEDNRACGWYATDGFLFPDSAVSDAHVKDGQSQTFAIGERVYFNRKSWVDGSDWVGSPARKSCVYSAKNAIWPINSQGTSGYFVGDQSVPPEQRKVLLNDLMFSSAHPQGTHFLLVDGSVHFVAENIDFTIYQAYATVAGGELSGSLQ